MLKIKPQSERAPKRLNNVEFVTEMMEYSAFGGMTQAFILHAIERMAKEVAESTPADYPKNSLVTPEVWIGIAKEVQTKLAKRNS